MDDTKSDRVPNKRLTTWFFRTTCWIYSDYGMTPSAMMDCPGTWFWLLGASSLPRTDNLSTITVLTIIPVEKKALATTWVDVMNTQRGYALEMTLDDDTGIGFTRNNDEWEEAFVCLGRIPDDLWAKG